MGHTRLLLIAGLTIPLALPQIGTPRYPQGGGYPGGGYPQGGGYPPDGYPPGTSTDRYPQDRYPQQPGVGLPRLPFPRRGAKDKTANAKQNGKFTSLRGTIVKFEDWELTLTDSDENNYQIACPPDTKYFKGREEIHPSILNPGDQILVNASQDSKGKYTAARITLTKEANPETVESTKVESAKDTPKQAPPAKTTEEDRPVIRRSPAPAADSPTTVVRKEDAEPLPGDDGPPRLKRKPAPPPK